MPAVVLTATIPAGESLSNAVDISAGTVLRIRMPDQWTPANISFQMAPTDTAADFRDLWIDAGEILLPVLPNRVVLIPDATGTLREGFLKIRSGTSQAPIPQAADRTFELVTLR
jgi:hypothetical protein